MNRFYHTWITFFNARHILQETWSLKLNKWTNFEACLANGINKVSTDIAFTDRSLNLSKWHSVFRTNDWWNYVIPPILGFYFLGKLECKGYLVNPSQIILIFLLMVLIASFGYFLGEWTDISDDSTAGKKNTLENTSFYFRVLILILNAASIAWVSFLLRLNYMQMILVIIQIIGFVLYSVPPIRLKRNPYASALLESIYSGTIMYLLVLSVNMNIKSGLVIMLACWGVIKGLRNFILHTIQDADNDRKAGVRTIGNSFEERKLLGLIRKVIVPLEVLFLSSFFLLLSTPLNWLMLISYICVVAYSEWHRSKSETMSRFGLLININLFHELVLMILCMVILAFYNPNWIFLIIIVLLVFNTYIKWITGIFNYIRKKISAVL